MVPRYDIVPIPEKLRNRMSSGSIMEFPAETAQSMNDFRADDQVGNISPRPLLLLHSANDSVTPTYESIEMFKTRETTGGAALARPMSIILPSTKRTRA